MRRLGSQLACLVPYKHSTSGPLEASHPTQASHAFQRLGGTEEGCKLDLETASKGLPSLSLLFYPMTLLGAFCPSDSLGLASNSQPDASALPPPVAQARLAA